MSIVVVGSVAFDDVTSPSGSVQGILGGAATYFSLAASYLLRSAWSPWLVKTSPPSTKMS